MKFINAYETQNFRAKIICESYEPEIEEQELRKGQWEPFTLLDLLEAMPTLNDDTIMIGDVLCDYTSIEYQID